MIEEPESWINSETQARVMIPAGTRGEQQAGHFRMPEPASATSYVVRIRCDDPGKMPIFQVGGPFLLMQVQTEEEGELIIDKNTKVLSHAGGNKRGLRVIEMFSGGFGGWHACIKAIGSQQQYHTQVVGIEIDWNACKAYCHNHEAGMLQGEVPWGFLIRNHQHWAIHASVESDTWLEALSAWRPHVAVMSPPCTSFSRAGFTRGLDTAPGKAFIHAIHKVRAINPPYVAIENVPGITASKDYQVIMDELKKAGYALHHAGIYDVGDLMPTTRSRWLAVLQRADDVPQHRMTMQKWQERSCSLSSAGVIVQWSAETIESLRLTPQEQKTYSDPKKAPGAAYGNRIGQTPGQVMQSRTRHPGDKAPTIMCQYRNQHNLPEHLLQSKGLMGTFIQDQGAPRWWTPIEGHMMHGGMDSIYVDHQMDISWKHCGNAITPLHAALPVLAILGTLDKSRTYQICDIIQKSDQTRLRGDNIESHEITGGTLYLRSDLQDKEDKIENARQRAKTFASFEHVYKLPPQTYISPDGHVQHFHRDRADPEEEPLPRHHGFNPKRLHEAIIERNEKQRKTEERDIEDHIEECRDDQRASSSPASTTRETEIDPDTSTTTDTIPFEMTRDVCFSMAQGSAWGKVAYEIEAHEIESIWNGQIRVALHPFQHWDVQMPFEDNNPVVFNEIEATDICLVREEEDIIKKIDPQRPLQEQTQGKWYDAIHREMPAHQVRGPALLSTEAYMQPGWTAETKIPWEELQETDIAFYHMQPAGALAMSVKGSLAARHDTMDFWTQLLTMQAMSTMGHVAMVKPGTDTDLWLIAPKGTTIPAPQNIVRIALSIQAMRRLMQSHVPNEGIEVTIKMQGATLWQGKVGLNHPLEDIQQKLQYAMKPWTGSRKIRIVTAGKTVWTPTTLQELSQARQVSTGSFQKWHTRGGGGPPAKAVHQIHTKNQVATILLTEGNDVHWVTEAVTKLLTKYGIQKMTAAIAGTSDQAREAILKMCHEADMPMQESAAKVATYQEVKKRPLKRLQRAHIEINPAEYTICDGYITDDQKAPLPQIREIRGKKSGVCIMTPSQAETWIRAGTLISADPLAMAVVGITHPGQLDSEQIELPVTDTQGRQVLLACTLIQLGGTHAQVNEAHNHKIKTEDVQIVAWTYWADEFSSAEWQRVASKPEQVLKEKMDEEGINNAILSAWGKSARKERQPTTPAQATSIQIHTTVPVQKIAEIMRASGYCHIYATPKDPEGRIDSTWKIIWLPGNREDVISATASVPQIHGLVKGPKGYGVRTTKADFDQVWKTLKPQEAVPSDIELQHVYRAEPFPHGCKAENVVQWGAAFGWAIRPIKSLGAKCWLIGAGTPKPPGIQMFNGTPIVMKLLPPKQSKEAMPILAGPRPTRDHKSQAGSHVGQQQIDPWQKHIDKHGTTGIAPTQVPTPQHASNIAGPTETRFKAYDAKLDSMQAKLDALAQSTDQRLIDAEKRETQFQKTVHQEMTKHQQDMTRMHQELTASVAQQFMQSDQKLDTTLQELKRMFQLSMQPRGKRREPTDDDDKDMEGAT